ncbi:hypothetical protein AA0119_g13184 [Alternaria tenuissima]|uniref:Beta-ketoacyl synthase-like N-terminal domain-containing protein n=2 Tax=Alternaria alternata complex TaxID=187734 RepID=A0A4Q4MPW2_ALTAL|nr:hypothetical protein AA0117_g13234 [Alternaria alternata]RYN85718.1 hypothetical protein AA0119_g13184 [Alternaria tenuissima]RYO03172.1 hypothetical protein AA0121_g13153 [Alternaria tenuissima]RYO47902.1 hypothetical protein AA0116_g12875 [Alternaria tenuissima]
MITIDVYERDCYRWSIVPDGWGVDSLDTLWDFLLQKRDAPGEIPPHRWEPWRQRSTLDAKILDSVTRKGYILGDLEGFDAVFFDIPPTEVGHMDSHQRLGLELAYEGLENAGIQPDRLAGTDTTVHIGVDSGDYSRMLREGTHRRLRLPLWTLN